MLTRRRDDGGTSSSTTIVASAAASAALPSAACANITDEGFKECLKRPAPAAQHHVLNALRVTGRIDVAMAKVLNRGFGDCPAFLHWDEGLFDGSIEALTPMTGNDIIKRSLFIHRGIALLTENERVCGRRSMHLNLILGNTKGTFYTDPYFVLLLQTSTRCSCQRTC